MQIRLMQARAKLSCRHLRHLHLSAQAAGPTQEGGVVLVVRIVTLLDQLALQHVFAALDAPLQVDRPQHDLQQSAGLVQRCPGNQ